MSKLKFGITAKSPLLMSRTSGDRNTVSTTDYIPGTTLQGVFAGLYFKNGGSEEDFYRLFFRGSLKFTNAYIGYKYNNSTIESYPVPFSVHKEKNGQKIYDLLFFENENNIQTVPYSSEMNYCLINGNNIYSFNVDKNINFHHQRDNDTGVSKDRKIFNYESVDMGQLFVGSIEGNQDEIDDIKKLIPDNGNIFIGRSKNSQYGNALFEIIQDINDNSDEITINDGKVSLTFVSDVILYNENGYSSANKNLLGKYLKDRISADVNVEKAFIKSGLIESYVAIWKMKKPADTCFLAGSCFLLSGLKETDTEKLISLQQNGIGNRRNEGFGNIAFGLQNNEELSPDSVKDSSHNDVTPPNLTKKIIFKSIEEYIIKTVRLMALDNEKSLERANKINMFPSKSLVSRLESFAVSSSNHKDFNDKIGKLKKDASDKLKELSFGNENFYEYLIKKEINVDDITEKDENVTLREIIKLSGYEANSISNKLYKEYFLTFFQSLRKYLKKEGVENG